LPAVWAAAEPFGALEAAGLACEDDLDLGHARTLLLDLLTDASCRGGGSQGVRPAHACVRRRGRGFADTERMISFPRPDAGKGAVDRATAAASSASTSGRASTLADPSRMKRVCFPEPSRTFFGSGSFAPWMKQRPTPLDPAAIEKIASDGRSVGE